MSKSLWRSLSYRPPERVRIAHRSRCRTERCTKPRRQVSVFRVQCLTATGIDWMTMSLEKRNLVFNNVAHVGPEFAQKKTEEWAAASKALRAQRPQHLDLAYAQADRTKWDLYPASDPKARCYVHIHGGYWQRGSKE